jgi:hypothetical protein
MSVLDRRARVLNESVGMGCGLPLVRGGKSYSC